MALFCLTLGRSFELDLTTLILYVRYKDRDWHFKLSRKAL